MVDSARDGYELNEISWWSNWAESKWLDKNAFLLLSNDFQEYFFNRGGFLRVPKRAEAMVKSMEAEFRKRNLSPSLFIQSDSLGPPLLRSLASRGYRIADQMSVMEMETPSFKVNPELTLEMGPAEGKLDSWAKVYLESFYGDTKLMRPVMAVLRRISRSKDVSLLLANRDGRAVGSTALFRSSGKLGAYCVGTIPGARGEHVASTMLDFSNNLAKNEGRKFVLQTILSDGVESLYIKLGFRRVYLKELFTRDASADVRTLKSEEGWGELSRKCS